MLAAILQNISLIWHCTTMTSRFLQIRISVILRIFILLFSKPGLLSISPVPGLRSWVSLGCSWLRIFRMILRSISRFLPSLWLLSSFLIRIRRPLPLT